MSLGNKPVILILGADGQLGNAVRNHLAAEGHHVVAYNKEQFDITEPQSYITLDDSRRPDVIINCAAFTQVAYANKKPDAAWHVNSYAVAHIAKFAFRLGATLIHISTDFVFGRDWDRRLPLSESDLPGPVNQYGCSKLGGEMNILQQYANRPFRYYILRTAGVFDMPGSTKNKNFPSMIAGIINDRGDTPFDVIDDIHTNLTRAEDLAKAVGYFAAPPSDVIVPTGTYHIANPGELTWCGVATAIANRLGGKVERTTKEKWWGSHGVDPNLVPNYTCLDIRKYLACDQAPDMPPIGKALDEWCAAYQELNR